MTRLLRLTALASLALSLGCGDPPVSPAAPGSAVVVVTSFQADSIDAIDLLFVIDNSSSMADEQAILARAVPEA